MEHREHCTLMRTAVLAWLLLVSAVAVIDHVALLRLAEQMQTRAATSQVEILQQRVAELTQRVEQQPQPEALPIDRYESERQVLEQRLSALEHALNNLPTADSLLPLQVRVEQLEARPMTSRQSTPVVARPRSPAPSKSQVIQRPFQIIGVELRANERFLAIQPSTSGSLSQVRLLLPGETEAGWCLQHIERDAAVFQQGNDTRRIALPTGRSGR
ncbi:hypothetical protein B6S59_17295 [Pseudomonas sp. A46]|nr:hypothetical protein [Pseudomonas sp. A46]OWJ93275.1 hypothetical protein B6S59_17295 [Pseudomonas sp. A46]